MTVPVRHTLELPGGFRSAAAGVLMASLDDQHKLLLLDVADITPPELEWQPKPGMNTIGMLLAHIAIVEVFWTQVGPEAKSQYECESVLGIGTDDDGMPAPEGASPPPGLAGKPLAFYQALLAKARAYANRAAARLTDEDLGRVFRRTRRNGNVEELNVRWVLYHMLEHFSGHYGQILLLRHQYRDAHRG
jgi:uncharacterized damage-inducible protein DinB